MSISSGNPHGSEPKPKTEISVPVSPFSSNIESLPASPITSGSGLDVSAIRERGFNFARLHGINDPCDVRAFEIGAVLSCLSSASSPSLNSTLTSSSHGDASTVLFDTSLSRLYKTLGLGDEEIRRLEQEERGNTGASFSDKWKQPFTLFSVVILCSVCAAVQGMDETVVNGAQIFYSRLFGIGDESSQRDTWLVGIVNAAPYLSSALVSCWLTGPMNNRFGRKGTIWITCAISAVSCIWQSFTNTWWHMFIARFILGFGIGPKSASVPMYASECAPTAIRGALGTMWQMWTAFGIMLGLVASVALFHIPDSAGIVGLNWRLMMGSAALPAFLVTFFIFSCPESPRWYMTKKDKTTGKGHVRKAYLAMCRLRWNKVQAARDVYRMSELLVEEELRNETQSMKRSNGYLGLIKEARTRRALVASQIVMIMQQLCGVNVIAYYSSSIFHDSGFSEKMALTASLGFGIINWLFAIPATLTIDTFGRRNLLLSTFPFLALCLLWSGLSFQIPISSLPKARLGNIAAGIYLFGIFYSPGAGPVPFTFSAEAYPLHARARGMAVATATTWLFNAGLALTWPSMHRGFGATGAFSFYAACNMIGFVATLLFVPETKGRTLEELDEVFSVPTRLRVRWGLRQASWSIQKYVLRRKVSDLPPVEKEWADANRIERENGERAVEKV